jgi:hypothetical protein
MPCYRDKDGRMIRYQESEFENEGDQTAMITFPRVHRLRVSASQGDGIQSLPAFASWDQWPLTIRARDCS